jgi:hypothetical protein
MRESLPVSARLLVLQKSKIVGIAPRLRTYAHNNISQFDLQIKASKLEYCSASFYSEIAFGETR